MGWNEYVMAERDVSYRFPGEEPPLYQCSDCGDPIPPGDSFYRKDGDGPILCRDCMLDALFRDGPDVLASRLGFRVERS